MSGTAKTPTPAETSKRNDPSLGRNNVTTPNEVSRYTEPLTDREKIDFLYELKQGIEDHEREVSNKDHKPYIGIEGPQPAGLPNSPCVVAIGPLNRAMKLAGSENVRVVETYKVEYLKAFLNRTFNLEPKIGQNMDQDIANLDICIRAISELQSQASEFYNYSIDTESLLSSSLTKNRRFVFLEILLLDSVFVLEVIWRYTQALGEEEKKKDKLLQLSMPKLLTDAQQDMILIDNQLPFFFLETLFNITFNHPSKKSKHFNLMNLCADYLHDFLLTSECSQAHENIARQQQKTVKHILDLLRICHAPPLLQKSRANSIRVPSITQLVGVGVGIWPSSENLLQFSRSNLQIPKIKINFKSNILIQNLILLEGRDHQDDPYIINYLHFMDGLIDTTQDVDILIKRGVINNHLGNSQAVADLFNGITAGSSLNANEYYYYRISEELSAYYENPANKLKAHMIRYYCSTPVIIVSTFAAGTLVVLALIQTIFTILSYHPSKK